MMPWQQRLRLYLRLIRFDRPIGTLLLLWPTLWALWLAGEGRPDLHLVLIFSAGVFLMRSAGCAINDFADRDFDGHVSRTRGRPLATGELSPREAVAVAMALALLAFGLVLLTNRLTVLLSLAALALAVIYPFCKRYTHFPQIVLGAAFAWAIPMAFAAQTGSLPRELWLLYIATLLWTVVYDTFYAMVDRADDLRAGIKSTAVLFGEDDRLITAILQASVIGTLILVGVRFGLGFWFYLGLIAAAGLFVYQQWLIRERREAECFRAFINNNVVGAVLFAGLVLDYLSR